MDEKSTELLDTTENPLKIGFKDTTPRSTQILMLIMASVICMGSYFVFDMPSAVQLQIMDLFDINNFEFTLLYSVYSMPNIIFPLIGGYLVDLIGVRWCTFIFASIMCIGHSIFSLGITLQSYTIAVIGRVVSGIGGENIVVAQSALISKWFKGKEMSLALGIDISLDRGMTVCNYFLEPGLYNATGDLNIGAWFGVIICLLSLSSAIVVIYCDRARDKRISDASSDSDDDERVQLSDIFSFRRNFWYITLNCFTIFLCIIPFGDIAVGLYHERFRFSKDESSYIVSLIHITGAVFSPFVGYALDRFGRRGVLSKIYLVLISSLVVALSHASYLIIPDCDKCFISIVPIAMIGIAFSVYVIVIWTPIPDVVEARTVGTAYGVLMSALNLGLAIGPLNAGELIDATGNYFMVSVYFTAFGVLGVITGVFINIEDRKTGGILNAIPKPEDEEIEESDMESFSEGQEH